MILPLGDSPNPPGVPVVNYGLLFANIAVYVLISLPLSYAAVDPRDPLLRQYVETVAQHLHGPVSLYDIVSQTSAYDLFIFRHGYRPAAPSVANLFFSLFLHANILHLAGNMLFLWIYGDNVEHRLGRVRYLLAYLACGLAATLFFSLFASGSELPLIGASGAISGVLGFYFLWFPRNRVRLLVFFFPFLIDTIMVPARLVLGIFLVLDNLVPFLISGGAASGVAHGAHIGGFFAGLGAAAVMDRWHLAARPAGFAAAPAAAEPPSPDRSPIEAALREGRYAEAARRYFSLPQARLRRVLSADDSLALAAWLRANGHPDAAIVLYRRHLRDYPSGPGTAQAHLGAGLVLLESLHQPTPAYQHFLDALDADPSPEVAARVRQALDSIEANRAGGGR